MTKNLWELTSNTGFAGKEQQIISKIRLLSTAIPAGMCALVSLPINLSLISLDTKFFHQKIEVPSHTQEGQTMWLQITTCQTTLMNKIAEILKHQISDTPREGIGTERHSWSIKITMITPLIKDCDYCIQFLLIFTILSLTTNKKQTIILFLTQLSRWIKQNIIANTSHSWTRFRVFFRSS